MIQRDLLSARALRPTALKAARLCLSTPLPWPRSPMVQSQLCSTSTSQHKTPFGSSPKGAIQVLYARIDYCVITTNLPPLKHVFGVNLDRFTYGALTFLRGFTQSLQYRM